MNIVATNTLPQNWVGDCLGIGIFEDQWEQSDVFNAVDTALQGVLRELTTETDFKGKANEITWSRLPGSLKKVIVVGLGKADTWTLDGLRQAASSTVRLANKQHAKTLALALPLWNNNATLSTQAIVEGVVLSLHQDQRFKSESENGNSKRFVEQVELLGLAEAASAITTAQSITEGVILARELVNAPANVVTPITLAETAIEIAQAAGFELEILEKADCEALGMGAFLGVAQASDLPPKFIHLTYRPQGTPRRKLAIIGKGLTFDSGGLNLKTAGGIETMKMDMAGAGATLGAAKVVGLLKPDVEVHFIVAATENMISGHAIHPGDVLTASNGKTIEINNTDAEGRLTLADALVFADKLGLDAVVDLATLTGACIVALGETIAGLWSPEDTLAEALLSAAQQAGEKFWRMPLEDKYFEGMKSLIADMKNTGPRAGGSITAALFLKQFVKNTAWAHLDIAGPVWTDKESGYHNAGATGFGVRTLVNWVLA
jgi:leucyl aminopeptidase